MIVCVPTGSLSIRSDVQKVVVSVPVPPMYVDNVHEILLDRELVVELARGPPEVRVNHG